MRISDWSSYVCSSDLPPIMQLVLVFGCPGWSSAHTVSLLSLSPRTHRITKAGELSKLHALTVDRDASAPTTLRPTPVHTGRAASVIDLHAARLPSRGERRDAQVADAQVAAIGPDEAHLTRGPATVVQGPGDPLGLVAAPVRSEEHTSEH